MHPVRKHTEEILLKLTYYNCNFSLLCKTKIVIIILSSNLTFFGFSCNAVHHSKVSGGEKCTLVNETKWQYYGTPGTGGNLTLTWTHQALAASHINIEVWGYQETGKVTLLLPVHKQPQL